MKFRLFHKLLGLALFIFLVNSAVTGALRANAKALYWKERPAQKENKSLQLPAVSLEQVFNSFQAKYPGAGIKNLQLKFLTGRPVYQIEAGMPDKKFVLMDAHSGEWISPVSTETALAVANAAAGWGTVEVLTVEKISDYKAWRSSPPRPVYGIIFRDPRHTEVYVDRETGESLFVLDDGKRLGRWIARLHELDFGNQGTLWITAVGILLTVLAFSGLRLALPVRRRLKIHTKEN